MIKKLQQKIIELKYENNKLKEKLDKKLDNQQTKIKLIVYNY